MSQQIDLHGTLGELAFLLREPLRSEPPQKRLRVHENSSTQSPIEKIKSLGDRLSSFLPRPTDTSQTLLGYSSHVVTTKQLIIKSEIEHGIKTTLLACIKSVKKQIFTALCEKFLTQSLHETSQQIEQIKSQKSKTLNLHRRLFTNKIIPVLVESKFYYINYTPVQESPLGRSALQAFSREETYLKLPYDKNLWENTLSFLDSSKGANGYMNYDSLRAQFGFIPSTQLAKMIPIFESLDEDKILLESLRELVRRSDCKHLSTLGWMTPEFYNFLDEKILNAGQEIIKLFTHKTLKLRTIQEEGEKSDTPLNLALKLARKAYQAQGQVIELTKETVLDRSEVIKVATCMGMPPRITFEANETLSSKEQQCQILNELALLISEKPDIYVRLIVFEDFFLNTNLWTFNEVSLTSCDVDSNLFRIPEGKTSRLLKLEIIDSKSIKFDPLLKHQSLNELEIWGSDIDKKDTVSLPTVQYAFLDSIDTALNAKIVPHVKKLGMLLNDDTRSCDFASLEQLEELTFSCFWYEKKFRFPEDLKVAKSVKTIILNQEFDNKPAEIDNLEELSQQVERLIGFVRDTEHPSLCFRRKEQDPV